VRHHPLRAEAIDNADRRRMADTAARLQRLVRPKPLSTSRYNRAPKQDLRQTMLLEKNGLEMHRD
jgi:hypothetical protein